MAETQKGLALVWGVQGITFTAALALCPGANQSLSYTQDSQKAYVANEAGEDVGRIDYDPKQTIKITAIATHATVIATAKANLDTWIPASGTLIVVADADGNVNANYLLVSATMNKTNNSIASADMELETFAADITTLMS